MEIIKTLIVCEKPDAAQRVARALDEENLPRKIESQGVPYFECHTKDEQLIVCSALGHLYGVDSKGRSSRRSYPIWDYHWAAKHLFDRASTRLARWVRVIGSLAANADRYINACDYDLEGSVIGHTILQYACNGAHANALRMKFSTMTEKELRIAFQKLNSKTELPVVDAGKCRHELDWLYGINLSRLLTESALRQGRGYTTLSTGRVQGPTLGFVVEREEEISCFVPVPFWTIDATIAHDDKSYSLEYERDKVASQAEAKGVCNECRDALLEVKAVESRETQQYPPYPFDLSSLQSEAYRHFGYSPARTLALAERLYLDALISYPRTSSQKLPPDVGYGEILQGIASHANYRPLVGKLMMRDDLRPNNGPKDDPAHPAIFPTGEFLRRPVSGGEAMLYDLISRRFMATFADSSLKASSRIILTCNNHRFFLSGSRIIRPGWAEFYRPYVFDDSIPLPDLRVGDRARVQDIKSVERFTQPPHRYNPSSLLKKMEDANIGTKATRAGIIDLLYARGYVREERIRASELADKVADTLSTYCPLIMDPSFTANLENLMEDIQNGIASRRFVLVEALQHLRPIMLSLAENEREIGSQLSDVIIAQKVADVTFDTRCPKCGLKLAVVRSRGTGKRFIGCNGKWQTGCNFTLPLPQFGNLTLLKRRCNACGFQMVQARSRGRRSLVSCPRCYATKAREMKPDSSKSKIPAQILREAPSAT